MVVKRDEFLDEEYLWNKAKQGGGDVTTEGISITANGRYVAPSGRAYTPVVVSVDPFFAEPKDVQFIDYDGTILYSYTPQEFAQLTELPSNPTHEGLTAQGWNWPLAEAKLYVASYGKLIIGQMYITDDGKTRLYITLEDPWLSPYLGLAVNGTAVIDWGDGTSRDTVTGVSTSSSDLISTPHTYSNPGAYVVTIDIIGAAAICGSNTDKSYSRFLWNNKTVLPEQNTCYASTITDIRMGSNIFFIGSSFYSCTNLQSINIPFGITGLGNYLFGKCSSLKAVVIPNGVSSFSGSSNGFSTCYNLSKVALPNDITKIPNYFFYNCSSLASVFVPSQVTAIGNNAFYGCSALKDLVLPNSITSINSYAFYNCYAIQRFSFPSSFSGTSIASYEFYNCKSLLKIDIPDGVTMIYERAFYGCNNLQRVSIPDGVTKISSNAFYSCPNLYKIVLPSTLTNIAELSFYNCFSLKEIHFQGTTPPTVANANAWTNLLTDCTIYVPYSEDHSVLNAYKTAANYPNPNTYTYVEE